MDSKGRAVIVDWNAGLVYPLRNGQPVRRPIVANPGADFHKHYLGSFVITEKQVEHRSTLYNESIGELQPGELGADMPYWQRIGRTPVGFHLSHLWEPERGLHASMGCYRLSQKSARWLFHWTDIGTPVHVVKSLCRSKWAYLAPSRCEVVASAQQPPD
jgi:lipoprotein-anchoring transpeptidase ErfK/SrfK